MVSIVAEKFEKLSSLMNEKLKRRWAGCEALALGRGGISAVAQATGMSRNTIRKGIEEVKKHYPGLADDVGDRVRAPGAGRPRIETIDQKLISDLKYMINPVTRGEPTSALCWVSKSTRSLADKLNAQGHKVSARTVSRLLYDMEFSLQSNRKSREGTQHPDRDAQFQYINNKVRSFQRKKLPVISVDAKKRELVGDFKNSGREWEPKGNPSKVRTHDFRDKELGVAIPYGVYDLTQDKGWVSVGIDHNTAEFAVESIRRWWRNMGHKTYPKASRLLITADAGSSNGYRSKLWKVCLQELATELGIGIAVCHFPPGTSKWNKVEHRMFCHITENWRGRPLISQAVIVNSIGHTTTRSGLTIEAAMDKGSYPTGIEVSAKDIANVRVRRDRFHGDWNYTILPLN